MNDSDMHSSMLHDLAESIRAWRKWYLIGMQAIRQRYARSRLGQFWISISFLITNITLGIVYTHLWQTDIHVFLPYLATSMVFWNLISGSITDSTTAFTSASAQMTTEFQPKGIFCLIVLFRQAVYMGHNFVVLVPLLLFFGVSFSPALFLLIPNIVLLVLALYWQVMLLAIVSTRFRDIPNIVLSFMQILFFVTPILWRPETIHTPEIRFWIDQVNPYAALLALCRAPILGEAPTLFQYGNVIACTLLGWAVTIAIFRRTGNKIIYWL